MHTQTAGLVPDMTVEAVCPVDVAQPGRGCEGRFGCMGACGAVGGCVATGGCCCTGV
jgi:hypothetical protein